LNKLPTIAFSLLLFSGVALWYLASDSLNFYIKNQIEVLGSNLMKKNVSVGNVNILRFQGKGTISNVVITPQSTVASSPPLLPILSIGSIELSFDPKSLKDDLIVINTMKVNHLTVNLNDSIEEYNFNQLNSHIKLAIQQSNIAQSQFPQTFKIAQINIDTAQVFNGETGLKENKTAAIKLMSSKIVNIGSEKGVDDHVIGFYFLQALLDEIEVSLKQ
jgi:hypothetical protein